MFYSEESPSVETSHFVLSYWEFTINAENPGNEIGKMLRDDGKTWFQFFEMNLKKV